MSTWRSVALPRCGSTCAARGVRVAPPAMSTRVQEQLDAVEAIAWMAQQPWCTGKVGMFGTSYGGFNSLQVAMHRPPALKAICPMYFTDNRYTDDCHYKGGAMQMLYDMAPRAVDGRAKRAAALPEPVGDRWARSLGGAPARQRAVAAAAGGAPGL